MSETEPETRLAQPVTETGGGLRAFFLAAILLVYGIAAFYTIVHVWVAGPGLFLGLLRAESASAESLALLTSLLFVIAGSVLGASLMSLQGLHKYAGLRGSFQPSLTGSYLLGPLAAGLLGFAVYALVRGGVLVFGTDSGGTGTDATADAAWIALGVLTGFGWREVGQKIEDVIATMFSSPKSDQPKPPPDPSGS